jgi:hypothetical protein
MQIELTLAVAVSIASLAYTVLNNGGKNDKEMFLKLGVITEKLDNLLRITTAHSEKFTEIYGRLGNLEKSDGVQTEQINELKSELHRRRNSDFTGKI